MSEEKPESTENESTEEGEEKTTTTVTSPINPLSRPTDTTLRPGFRNPANVRSKVQRKKRKKR